MDSHATSPACAPSAERTAISGLRRVTLIEITPNIPTAASTAAETPNASRRNIESLQHPHILPLFDSGEAEGFLFYVMPYVEGESLRDRLDREKQLPVDEAVRIVTDVAEALDHAHRQGVIHRDIKPANILLRDGRPLVADFGIALAVSAAGGGRLTETGLSMGTPYYMSPEQATADRDPDARSDIYSAGSVLYEMLVGDPPHTASTAQAVLAKILTEDAPAPAHARGSIPANVDAAIRKALERIPADRFASARDFGRALGDPSYRYGVSAAETVPGVPGPYKAVAVATTAVAVGLAAGLGWSVSRPEAPRGLRGRS
jgi:serine/threonine protein kinase